MSWEQSPTGKAWRKRYNASIKPQVLAAKSRYVQTLHGRIKTLINTARRNAKLRGHECSITYDDLVNLYDKQQGKCALTGRVLSNITGDINTISIDRIDNNIGYNIDNIRLVIAMVNIAKMTRSDEELFALCRDIVQHNSC